MRILIIEDEEELAGSVSAYLSGERYTCEIATDYASALEKLSASDYDCILLDIMLPGGSGMDLLEEIRKMSKQDGVVIISAKNSIDDKVKGLHLGADDYLPKPFHLSELGARVYSVIRRKQFNGNNVVDLAGLSIDLQAKSVTAGGQPLHLTRKEFDLLQFFIANKNKVISKSAIAEHLSGDLADMMDNHDFIYAHVKNLKRKLSEYGAGTNLKTVYGTGYKWEV